MEFELDHVAVGVPRVAEAAAVVAGELGGRPYAAGPGPGFRWWQYRFANAAILEILEPASPEGAQRAEGERSHTDGGFLHRFLEQRGPGVHHVTFKTPDLHAAMEHARGFGYDVVGFSDFGDWKEAFLHPKQALGIVVQLAQQEGSDDGIGLDAFPPVAASPAPLTLHSVRLAVRDADRARRQWGELLGGKEESDGRALLFRWAGSALTVRVEVDAAGDEGARALEISGDRHPPLPEGPHPVLGVPLVTR